MFTEAFTEIETEVSYDIETEDSTEENLLDIETEEKVTEDMETEEPGETGSDILLETESETVVFEGNFSQKKISEKMYTVTFLQIM